MKSFSLKNICQFLILVVIFALSFEILPAWIPSLRKGWMLLLVAFVAIIVYRPKQLVEGKFLAIWIAYCLAVFSKVASGSQMFSSYPIAIYEVLILFVAVFLSLSIISVNNQRFIKITLFVTFVFLIIDTIGSYFLLKQYPSAIRTAHVLIQEEGASAGYALFKFGLADYGFCHGLPILVPPLFYLFKTYNIKKGLRWLFVIAIALCSALVWMSESTTALILIVVLIILGFMTTPSKNSISVIVLIVLVIPFIISDALQLSVLGAIGSLFESDSPVSERIFELEHSIILEEQTGDLEGRMNRYSTSLEMFYSSPLWGASSMPGRHSGLLDRLGVLGLIGFVPLSMLIIGFFRKIYCNIPKSARAFFVEAVISGIAMTLSKSMWGWPMLFCMFVIMPFLFICNFDKAKT